MPEAETENSSPELIRITDLQGDTHFHMKLHDEPEGKASGSWDSQIEAAEMIKWLAKNMPQIQYLVVTDHLEKFDTDESRFPPTGHKYGVEHHYNQVDMVSAQLAKISALNERFPDFKLITGLEASIRWDGSVNASPRMLNMFDVVVASDHHYPEFAQSDDPNVVTQNPTELVKRFVRAVSNPGIDIIGHPGRKYKDWQQVDWSEIGKAAAEYDKAIEINLANLVQTGTQSNQADHGYDFDPASMHFEPSLNFEVLEKLAKTGVKITLGTDVHRLKHLVADPPLKLLQARQFYDIQKLLGDLNKAGFKKSQVINTYSASELIAWAKSHDL